MGEPGAWTSYVRVSALFIITPRHQEPPGSPHCSHSLKTVLRISSRDEWKERMETLKETQHCPYFLNPDIQLFEMWYDTVV